MKIILVSILILICACIAGAQPSSKPAKAETPEAMKAEIEALRSADVAWRKIAWKSCLLEGLKASREQKKPMILWVFIDRPVDDQRC